MKLLIRKPVGYMAQSNKKLTGLTDPEGFYQGARKGGQAIK